MTIQQIAQEIIDAREKATQGPWYIDGSEIRADGSPESTDMGFDCTFKICDVPRLSEKIDGFANDRIFILTAANHSADIAQALLIAVEALERCTNVHLRDGRFIDVAEEALDKIKELQK